jgi:3-oxoacyl-[acyl-carrier protein] reductase
MMKTAIITGGSGDLAKAIRCHLETEGWKVLSPGRAEMDVSSAESVNAFFSGVESVDLLVNNAGITHDRLFENLGEQEWDHVLDVCLKGAFLCSRGAMQKMAMRRAGHIVNVGSFSALYGTAGQTSYAAAKAGMIGLTKSLAVEYGGRNVRVNCVLPGFLETKMTARLLADDERRKKIAMTHLLRRFNTVDDAARFIVFLHSMSHVSSQVFQLDSRLSSW